ncbi:SIR2 family protein [Escherichia coli]|uniref:SIR2 family protein n=1 Tax=Escherichia coli TaxID=562 RepID=UPI000854C748|nr:SIR2 family protein [Escherichia coli]EFB1501605.1 hypothetical protein [Escherichia albertii]EFY6540070.1 hypothetical protein [Shigella sonnei]EEY5975345.1 hypothetical protein [Escherichia coli]EEZ4371975.1 hypothetical protein [Escherichia coli]EFI4415074.1 hypothetical protein [Escherichia coli]
MEDSCKKKIMVVVGAGASVELGMPSVSEIDKLFSLWAKDGYTLASDKDKSLYCYIKEEVNRHYGLNPKKELRKETNFEELLYVILNLSAALGDNNYNFPMNAFWGIRELPKIIGVNGEKSVDGNDLRHLYSRLNDKLIGEFRERCKIVKEEKKEEFLVFEKFINQLNNDYDVAFITLNYDNLITQACPTLFTGFSKSTGLFEEASVYAQSKWGLIYHLHGSVHFDMQGTHSDMHAVKWNNDLHSEFNQNAFGRNSQNTSEGISIPTSAIVAGYAKTSQIQRVPFRTYYSKIDEIAYKADAYLFLGYGFNDPHLNNSLHSIRDGKHNKPVVIIDWASDTQDPMRFRHDEWSINLCKTVRSNANEMATRNYKHSAPEISKLKSTGAFEVSCNPDYPLSIWYGGFIQACSNFDKIKYELGM